MQDPDLVCWPFFFLFIVNYCIMKLKRKNNNDDNKESPKSGKGKVLGSILARGGLGYLKDIPVKILEEDPDFDNSSIDAERIKKELIEEAKRKGVSVEEEIPLPIKKGENISKKSEYRLKNTTRYTGKGKSLRFVGKIGEKADKLLDRIEGDNYFKKLGKKITGQMKEAGTDKIILAGSKNNRQVDSLAHELGHRFYREEGRNTLPGMAHKMSGLTVVSSMATPMYGYSLGKRIVKGERGEDKKVSNLEKSLPVAIPVIANLPNLASEYSASKKGLEILRKHGASPEVLGKSRSKYKLALSSYLLGAGRSLAASIGAVEAGKYRERRKKEPKK